MAFRFGADEGEEREYDEFALAVHGYPTSKKARKQREVLVY